MTEILIKIGGPRDGQPIAIKPDGWLIAAQDMKDWLADSKVPAILAGMPLYQQRRHTREVAIVKWWTEHTAAEAATQFDIRGPTPEEAAETADKTRQIYVEERVDLETHGLDVNWGFQDLKSHFVVRTAELTLDEVHEYLDRKYVDTGEIASQTKDGVYRFAYEADFDAGSLSNIRDKETRIDVDRVALPLSKSRFEEVV